MTIQRKTMDAQRKGWVFKENNEYSKKNNEC